jgi:probable phosphoglycerate mutase
MGSLDVPATDIGLTQAATLRAIWEGNFSRVYSSPLRRSVDTATAIFPPDAVIVDQRLRERGLGDWEGMSKSSVRQAYPGAFLPNKAMDASYTPPGGEELSALLRRIRSFLNSVLSVSEPNPILVVTHNGWIRTAQLLCGHIGLEDVYTQSVPYLEPMPFRVETPLALRGPS